MNFNFDELLYAMSDKSHMDRAKDWRLRLEAALKKSGVSKADLARRMNVDPGYIQSVFGKRKSAPNPDRLVAICDALNVSVSYILFGFEMDAELERLSQKFQNLSKEDRAFVIAFLDRVSN